MHIPFSTIEERHLVFVYVGVWLTHGGYLAWIVGSWLRSKPVRTLP